MTPARRLPTVRQKEILYALTQGQAICNLISHCKLYPSTATHSHVSFGLVNKMVRYGWVGLKQRPHAVPYPYNEWVGITELGREAFRGYR